MKKNRDDEMNFDKIYVGRVVKFLMVVIIILLGINVLYQSQYSNGLFSKALRNSEGMTLNGGKGFASEGFFSNGGLPDIAYDTLSSDGNRKKFVKLTYPPAPHWLAGLYIKVCGFQNDPCYRIFPGSLGIIALIAVAGVVLTELEPVKSVLMMLSLAFVPATIIMMHGLTYLAYSSTLYLMHLALLLKIFKENSVFNNKNIVLLFIAGFIQGWFSWDYLFLICLSPVPFALLFVKDTSAVRRSIFIAVLACSGGFLCAHLLHLIQVVVYRGGILAAYEPLYKKTMNRFDGSFFSEDFHVKESRLRIVINYLNVYAGSEFFYRINFLYFLGMSTILMFVKEAHVTFNGPFQGYLHWKSSLRNVFVILTAFIISFLWIFIMKQHAAFHADFFPMHLYLLYFVCILTILECVSFKCSNGKMQET